MSDEILADKITIELAESIARKSFETLKHNFDLLKREEHDAINPTIIIGICATSHFISLKLLIGRFFDDREKNTKIRELLLKCSNELAEIFHKGNVN